MLRATGKSQPVSSFYRVGTQDSERAKQGSQGHWPLALSPVFSSPCTNLKGYYPGPAEPMLFLGRRLELGREKSC